MRASVWIWAVFVVLLSAPGLLGLAGITLYAHARESGPARQRQVSCPSPTSAFPERKGRHMQSTTHKAEVPLIDRDTPLKTETATFGLG